MIDHITVLDIVEKVISIFGVLVPVIVFVFRKNYARKKDVSKADREVYSKALKYITLVSELHRMSINDKERRRMLNEESNLYYSFHDDFLQLVGWDKAERYNTIRNQIANGVLSQAEAYQEVVKLIPVGV